MQNVKTAISIPKNLFDQADNLARIMNVSRSKLFVMTLEDYLERQKNRELLAQINAAYSEEPDSTEKKLLKKAGRQHRRLLEGEW